MSVTAYDYPLLGVFLSLLWFFLFVAWFFVLARVVIDIFRSHDMGGWAKAIWFAFVLFLPLLGVFAYVIVRGPQMASHERRDIERQYDAFAASAGGRTTTNVDELAKLVDLRDRGALSDAEFEQQKTLLLR